MTWPTATLDNGARARILAAAIPNAAVVEVEVDVPFDEVWGWLSDLERSVPELDPTVAAVEVVEKKGMHWRIRASAPYVGVKLPFDVRMEDGFCLMRARWRLFTVVMAATPLPGGRTRITHVEGVPLPFTRWMRPVLRRFVSEDVRGMIRHFR
ncbi:MAG TPA: SRPBCC family protein [Acidimicrobiales bacterium]|nr:SRPBCC family protein [Acidimicrobiales bacterium]